jgi:hypothetical protein
MKGNDRRYRRIKRRRARRYGGMGTIVLLKPETGHDALRTIELHGLYEGDQAMGGVIGSIACGVSFVVAEAACGGMRAA